MSIPMLQLQLSNLPRLKFGKSSSIPGKKNSFPGCRFFFFKFHSYIVALEDRSFDWMAICRVFAQTALHNDFTWVVCFLRLCWFVYGIAHVNNSSADRVPLLQLLVVTVHQSIFGTLLHGNRSPLYLFPGLKDPTLEIRIAARSLCYRLRGALMGDDLLVAQWMAQFLFLM